MRSRDRIATRTDLFVLPRDTVCVDRGHYQVLRTGSMPSYQMGNYLVLDRPPDATAIHAWLARCRQELGDLPISKRILLWETESGDTWPPHDQEPPPEYNRLIVLMLDAPPESRLAPDEIALRPVTTDRDWQLVPELSEATLEAPIPGYAPFIRWRYDQYRQSLAQNPGHQWGAWHGDTLVASLGLFSAPDALRFQEVQTHPGYRRRGICAGLCSHALRHHMAAEPGKPAIIVAHAESQAERIYRRIGFAELGWQHTLEYPEPIDRAIIPAIDSDR